MRGHEIMQESRGLPLELGSLRRVVIVEFPKPCLATIVQFEGALGIRQGSRVQHRPCCPGILRV
jgi:hypothetical protein